MLLCLTKIDDLPEVEANLARLAALKGWELVYLNAPELAELDEYFQSAKAIFMNPNKSHIIFNRKVLGKFKELAVICTASTGTVHIDQDAAADLGIKIIHIKRYLQTLRKIPSTAELAFALTLDGLRKITRSHNDAFKENSWDFEKYIGKQLKDLTIGVVGYGRLGTIYSKMMHDAGAELKVLDPRLSFDFAADHAKFVQAASEFDVLALHIHAEGNEDFLGKALFNELSSDVVIVNTSRGEIVDHGALFEFLDSNPNAYYCTDVLPGEGSRPERERLVGEFAKRNVLLTQHIGGMSSGARKLAFGLASKLLLDAYGVAYE